MSAELEYVRFGVPGQRSHPTLEGAMRSAFADVDENTASPVRITEGGKVYDRRAMELWWEHRNFYDEEGLRVGNAPARRER